MLNDCINYYLITGILQQIENPEEEIPLMIGPLILPVEADSGMLRQKGEKQKRMLKSEQLSKF